MPGWEISVLAMDGMRADRLRFVPVAAPSGGESEDTDEGRGADHDGGAAQPDRDATHRGERR